jgi:hypothetical protein
MVLRGVLEGGDSIVEDQSFWLSVSPHATQLKLSGGHAIYEDQPEACEAEIVKLVEAARSAI